VSEAEGWSARDQLHEYHRSNLVTWLRAPQPTLTKVELDIQIDPAVGGFTAKTKLHLRNEHDHALQSFAITTSPYWEVSKLACTGVPRPVTMWPSDISGMLWTARTIGGAGAPALEPGETCVIDCEYECPTYRLLGREPSDPWIIMLEGGILLNSLELDFLPIVGFNEAIGAPLDLKPFRPEAGDGLAPTRPFFGSGRPIEVDAIVRIPEEYRANLPGVLESDSVAGGWRTMHWKTDKPVSELFHIVAGRWVETKGARSSIWHSPQHSRNVPSMVSALDGAREHYSRWFGEYPWKELRVSEFPGLLDYAQSGETNIVFSESMGFRALATRDVDAAFAVTAHEAAHQWWGGMLIPGEGPGGNILSEGLAQYSAARLIGVLRGERMRQSFMRQLEYSYIELRDPDSEDTLAEFDDGSPDAYTLLYHKGGWVFWMLANEFGYEASDRAHRAFIAENRDRRDHPLLADYLRTMGSYAVDDRRFEQFVEDWFESTRVGHYQIEALDSRQIPSRSGWWRTTVRVSNIGGVRMPIDVAFTNGEDRWSVHGDADFHEERMRVTIRPGDAFDLTVETPFEPREAIVDPDVCVLQVGRSAAVVSLADVRDDSYANYAPGFARSPSPAPVDGSDQGDGADEE
jgi:hypothetical protein